MAIKIFFSWDSWLFPFPGGFIVYGKVKDKKKQEDINWDNKSSGIFGWFLWTFDQKYWKTII
jgi:hypothetical protein